MKKALAALGLVALAATAQAQLLTDTFTYPDGPLVGAPGSPWVTTSGTAGQLNVVSGELFLSDDDGEDAAAPFSMAITDGVLSASFTFRADSDEASSAAGDYIAHFLNTGGSTQIARFFLINAANADEFSIGVSTTAATPNATFAGTFAVGQILNVTLSYDFTSDLASLSIGGFGTIIATDAVNFASIDRFQWREGAGSQGDAFVDNLSVVPEPATWMLMGLGLLLGAQRLRRKA